MELEGRYFHAVMQRRLTLHLALAPQVVILSTLVVRLS